LMSTLGSEVATLHSVGNSFEHEKDRKRSWVRFSEMLDWSRGELESEMESWDARAWNQTMDVMTAEVLAVDRMTLGRTLCHGDLNHTNMRWSSDRRLIFFDFDLCCFSSPAFDMSAVRLGTFLSNDREKLWQTFLNAYTTLGSVSQTELEAVRVLTPLRLLWTRASRSALRDSVGHYWISDNGKASLVQNVERLLTYGAQGFSSESPAMGAKGMRMLASVYRRLRRQGSLSRR
jgi:Ser/Thr protein kinase RdoA (MazF antagonist)